MAGTADELGDAITQRMSEIGMSQQELSERSGVSVSTVRRIQRGQPQRRNDATLAALSRALEWPDDHLRQLASGTVEPSAHTAPDLAKRVEKLEHEVDQLTQAVRKLEDRR